MKKIAVILLLVLLVISMIYKSKLNKGRITSISTPTPMALVSLTPTPRPIKLKIVFDGMNTERNKAGLPSLNYNFKLESAAEAKACEIKRTGIWSHKDENGDMSWHFFLEAGYGYDTAGENLADSILDQYITERFMESPTHKENILNQTYKDVGIARCGQYVAVEFASPYVEPTPTLLVPTK